MRAKDRCSGLSLFTTSVRVDGSDNTLFICMGSLGFGIAAQQRTTCCWTPSNVQRFDKSDFS